MRNQDYWKKRFEQLEASQIDKGVEYYNRLSEQYRTAIAETEKEISAWYNRYAENNEITLTEAKKQLSSRELAEFRMNVKEYIVKGKTLKYSDEWSKTLEAASTKFHVSRLEALKVQMQQQAEAVFGNEVDDISNLATNVYTDGYYHTAYEVQKGVGVGTEFAKLDADKVKLFINKPWAADGKNFSERIWSNRQNLVNTLDTKLTQCIIQGKSPQTVIDEISQRFEVSKSQAGNLVMTETAFFSSAAQKDCFNALEVKQFEIVATLDNRTSVICQNLDGQHFKMADFKPGITAPPFHCRCRSTTCPYFTDDAGKRAARDVNGKYYTVPDKMKYTEWKKSFIDNAADDAVTTVDKISTLNKLKNSGMTDENYNAYLSTINDNQNPSIRNIYSKYGDKISSLKEMSGGGCYQPASNSITFGYPCYSEMNKFGTLAHEYGHFFDAKTVFTDLHFTEIEAIQASTKLTNLFQKIASSSDEFLKAVRADKAYIKSIFTDKVKQDLIAHNVSNGVQDAIDGLFPKHSLRWGHGERYYNRRYASLTRFDKYQSGADKKQGISHKKQLQQVYKDLGLDASNQTKVKSICRQYEAASEMWANIMSAETCGSDTLTYVKKYLPNSYQAMLKIIKGVK